MRQVLTQGFAKKTDFANLKSDVDKLNIHKLKNVLINLSNSKVKLITQILQKQKLLELFKQAK